MRRFVFRVHLRQPLPLAAGAQQLQLALAQTFAGRFGPGLKTCTGQQVARVGGGSIGTVRGVALRQGGIGTLLEAQRIDHLRGDIEPVARRRRHNQLAATHPDRLKALVDTWWREAERCQVLPLDDRFAARFAENGQRVQGHRHQFVMHAGMGHLPTDVAPDVRGRHYRIEAQVRLNGPQDEGVLIAHGDATSGYSLYLQGGHLVHDLNIGGVHQIVRSDRPVTAGHHVLGLQLQQGPLATVQLPVGPPAQLPAWRRVTLLIDGQAVGTAEHAHGFNSLISWSGLDIGLDRGSPVSHYEAPFVFTGQLRQVTVTLSPLGGPDPDLVGQAEMARQ